MTSVRDILGPAVKRKLTPNLLAIHVNREDLISVQVEALDSKGQLVPRATHVVRFTLPGAGRITSVGNGDPGCREADKPATPHQGQQSLFGRFAKVYVQAVGQAAEMTLKTAADGLASTTTSMTSQITTARRRLA